MNTFKQTFDKLSAIDVNEHSKDKNGYTYLSWTWAWKTLVENTEVASYIWQEDKFFSDGSMEVSCVLTVDGHSLPMWLAVTDYNNKSIPNPDAWSINTARMRCLVKAMAMFGLGHYIYAGESFPENTGTLAPASDASPGDDADPKLESQTFEEEPDLTIEGVLKSIIPCGGSKGKSYGEVYLNDGEELLKAGKRFGVLKNPTKDQNKHLTNLRFIVRHQMQNNNGVLA
jgi:hypothetical protein